MPKTPLLQSTISAALDIVSDSWTILLLRELFLGSSTWGEFTQRLNISPATLNKRLKQLVDAGCLTKDSKPGSRTTSYVLTEAGVALFPFMAAAREWQITWDLNTKAYTSPWVHNCGNPLECKSICTACDLDVLWEDLVFEDKKEYERIVAARVLVCYHILKFNIVGIHRKQLARAEIANPLFSPIVIHIVSIKFNVIYF